MIAQSPDNGATWFKQGGATQYTLPIIQAGTPAGSVAQTVWTIPQHSSFINQTTMTVDNNDNPMVATYWAPGTLGSTNSTLAPNATTNNPNRQYMLVYYDGTQWRTSQITHRISDTAFDTTAADVRDLGRPIVLTDAQNRTLVVTRSEDSSLGSSSNANLGLNKNNIVVYYSANLDTANPTWSSITLDSANMGTYEPTYDAAMWKTSGILDLFYEPTGLGSASTAVKVLEWNEQHYFSVLSAVATPHPGDLDFDGAVTNSDLQAMLDALKNSGTFKSSERFIRFRTAFVGRCQRRRRVQCRRRAKCAWRIDGNRRQWFESRAGTRVVGVDKHGIVSRVRGAVCAWPSIFGHVGLPHPGPLPRAREKIL